MLKKILLVIAALGAVLLVVVALQPSEFRVTRTATIAAPPAVVFAQVNDFHNWEAWSPWAKLDPDARETFEGSSAGTGAIFRWAGNAQVGQGSMTLIENQPSALIRIKLEFLKPFKAVNIAEFAFQPQDQDTVVTWSMAGRNNFLGKAIGLVMNCDKMVGGQFEQGLAQLKTVAEAVPNT